MSAERWCVGIEPFEVFGAGLILLGSHRGPSDAKAALKQRVDGDLDQQGDGGGGFEVLVPADGAVAGCCGGAGEAEEPEQDGEQAADEEGSHGPQRDGGQGVAEEVAELVQRCHAASPCGGAAGGVVGGSEVWSVVARAE